MAYSGFLIKVGDYKIPHSWIRAETYKVTLNGQDLDSYRDSNGLLHRTALEHTVAKVEFETPPLRTNKQWSDFMKNIQKNYINKREKKVSATVYIAETDDYITQDMYVPDIETSIYMADGDKILYEQIRIAFIGY